MTAGVAVDLGGRVALVTGASRGIGAAIARRLAEANARVALHYGSSHDSARAVAASITAAGHAAPLLVSADVASEDERRRLHREVVAGLGAPSRDDVANAVLYLVSPLGSYANGIAIPLNGGSYLH